MSAFELVHSLLTDSYLRVDAQWITAKKDWQEAKRRYKMQQKNGEYDPAPESEPATYETEMDEMRCIMYLHGGLFDVPCSVPC